MGLLEQLQDRQLLDETCHVHGCRLWLTKMPILGEVKELKQCLECTEAAVKTLGRQLNHDARVSSQLAETYAVFDKRSLVSDKLKVKSLATYEPRLDVDRQAINFVKRMEQFYRQGGVGNAIITGPSGVGKSHLTYGMAQWLNEQFKAHGQPKSVVFVSVVDLFTRIRESMSYANGYSPAEVVTLLSKVDYLFLDDLGKESRKADGRTNEWAHQILYEILDKRQNTIINTNLNSQEIKVLYADDYGNGALSSRILEGVTGNSFVYPKDMQDRRY